MIERAREHVREAGSIVAFTGAGLSAESGIPTFRDAATGGLWARSDPTVLASPPGFARNPDLVIEWYGMRRRAVAAAAPNAAHLALAARPDIVNVTQNVDDLLERAGASGVIRLHGDITRDRCHAGCGYEETVDLGDPPPLRVCPVCAAALRPAVVWFGEALPPAAWEAATNACLGADLLLVVGTSAEVYPAAGLIGLARERGARIIVVNTNPSGAGSAADLELIGPAGVILPEVLGA